MGSIKDITEEMLAFKLTKLVMDNDQDGLCELIKEIDAMGDASGHSFIAMLKNIPRDNMPAGLGSMLDAAINRLEKEPDFKPASKSSASFEDNGEDIVDDDKLLIHCPMTAKEAFNWVLSFIITSWFNYPSQHPVMNICGACENRKGCELEVEECPDYLLGVEKVGNSFELCIKEWSKAAITLLLGTTTAWNKVILGSKNCGDNIIFAKEK